MSRDGQCVKRFQPFFIAKFCGRAKPNSVSDNKMDLHSKLTPRWKATFYCDVPTRVFLKCIKGHNVAIVESDSILKYYHKRRFPPEQKMNSVGSPTLLKVYAQMDAGLQWIQSFVLDYMHLVCLGVFRQIILKRVPREWNLSETNWWNFIHNILSLNGNKCCSSKMEGNRILTVFIVHGTLRVVLPECFFNHFLTLTAAMSMLLDSDNTRHAYNA